MSLICCVFKHVQCKLTLPKFGISAVSPRAFCHRTALSLMNYSHLTTLAATHRLDVHKLFQKNILWVDENGKGWSARCMATGSYPKRWAVQWLAACPIPWAWHQPQRPSLFPQLSHHHLPPCIAWEMILSKPSAPGTLASKANGIEEENKPLRSKWWNQHSIWYWPWRYEKSEEISK